MAQSTRDVSSGTQPKPQFESVQRQSRERGFFEKLFKKEEETEVEQFRANLKRVEKRRKKAAKIAAKPQYSDPTYFGHKKPPVKRPPGKQKFCKECQMKH